MKKIYYFDPNFDDELYGNPANFKEDDIREVMAVKYFDWMPEMHVYDTLEDFVDAFNNGFISDEGYIRTADIEPFVQIFKEKEKVTDEEMKLISEHGPFSQCVDQARHITAFRFSESNLKEADNLVDDLNELDDKHNWYLGNPYEDLVPKF